MESLFQAIYSDVVRIDSDSSNDDSWLEIDAIKISGGEGEPEPEPESGTIKISNGDDEPNAEPERPTPEPEPEPEPYPKQLYASRVKSFSSEWTNSQ